MNTKLMKIYEDLTFKSAKDNDVKRENANIDGDTAMGTMLKYGSEGAKQFNEMYILDPKYSKAHRDGDIHIHDLDFFTLTTTCCQIDLVSLFKGGFSTGHGYLREPNDIASYSALACIAIQSNQNDQHGGQSVPNFDYSMAPGVKKTYRKRYRINLERAIELLTDAEDPDAVVKEICEKAEEASGEWPTLENQTPNYKKEELALLKEKFEDRVAEKIQRFAFKHAEAETDKATFQAMEALIHNLNTMHSRAGAQIPFSSLNYGTDTSPEGRLVMKNLLYATERGLGNGETPIFPIQIFKVKEGVNYNPEDKNYDLYKLSMRVSAKRLSLTSHLSTHRTISNITSPVILKQRLHIWAAVQELWAMFTILTERLHTAEETLALLQLTFQDLQFFQIKILTSSLNSLTECATSL